MTGTMIVHAVRESINRRSGLVLLGSALLVAAVFAGFTEFSREKSELVVYLGPGRPIPASQYVAGSMKQVLQVCTGFWMYLTIFAMAALLVAPFERGYLEMLLAKPWSRSRLLAGRFLGAMVLAAAGMLALVIPVAGRYRLWVDFPLYPYLQALLYVLVLYAVLGAFMQLITVLLPNTGVVILSGFAMILLSNFLHQRAALVTLTDKAWALALADYAYYVLPKYNGIRDIVIQLGESQEVTSWMPVWSSVLFGAACWGLAAFAFSRKSY